MRTEMFGFALAATMLFQGQIPEFKGSLTRDRIETPAWLSIPATADVAAIDYTGKQGTEKTRGKIRVQTSGNAGELVTGMMTGLAKRGFVISHQALAPSIPTRMQSMVMAYHPDTGQRATVTYLAGLTGEELQISFVSKVAR